MDWIDSHVHVWSPDTASYPVRAGTDWNERRPRDFTPETLFRYARPSRVRRFVLIAHQIYYGADNSYMLDTLRRWPDVFRIVGFIDHRGGGVAEEMAELHGHGFVGFRVVPEAGKEASWLRDPGYDAMFRAAARTGQAICPLVRPEALGDLDRMCGEHADTMVVIDHLASVGSGEDIDEGDVQALCSMAAHPRVFVKLSAFYALGAKRQPHDDLAPMIERVVAAFGPRRLMWGSDAPYQVRDETYEDSIKLVRDRLGFLSDADRVQILAKTAERVFFSP